MKTRLLATVLFSHCLAAPVSAFDPFGIVNQVARQVLPREVANTVRSITQASAMAVPASASTPDTSNGQAILYTRNGCGYCMAAVRHLDSTGARYVEKNVEYDPIAAAEFRGLGAQGVPVLVAGTQVITGFEAARYDKAIASMPPPRAARADAVGTSAGTPPNPAILPAIGDRLSAAHGVLPLLGGPRPDGIRMGTLARGKTVTYVGPARNGYLFVRAGQIEAWAEASKLSPAR